MDNPSRLEQVTEKTAEAIRAEDDQFLEKYTGIYDRINIDITNTMDKHYQEMSKPLLRSRESKKRNIIHFVERHGKRMEYNMHRLVGIASRRGWQLDDSVYEQTEKNRETIISLLDSLRSSYESAPEPRKALRWSEMLIRNKYFARLVLDAER